MANLIYPKFKEALLAYGANANSDIMAGTLKAALVDLGTYAYSAAHQFQSSLTGVVGTAQTIGTKTNVNGLLDGADVTFPSVTGATVEALVLYLDTGTPATSRLVAFIDTGVTGLPVTPNGGDVVTAWNAGGILQL